jgi:hypothetical protein
VRHRAVGSNPIIDEVYLPFSAGELAGHFAPVKALGEPDRHLAYYLASAKAAAEFRLEPAAGSPAEVRRTRVRGRQMEKDERFWVAAALMSLFHADGKDPLIRLLSGCLGEVPPFEGVSRPPEWITHEAWNRGYLEAFEVARIAAWKNAQSVTAITVNKPEEIEDCTRAAMSVIKPWRGRKAIELITSADWDEWRQTANRAIGWVGGRRGPSSWPPSGLLSLKGVEYPMATAILDILDPDVWPVLDKWAAATVFGKVPSRYCAARYAAYAEHLATEGTGCWNAGLSIHELDVEAQSASMNHNLPAGWQNTELPPCT